MNRNRRNRFDNIKRGFVQGLAELATAGIVSHRFKKVSHRSTKDAFYGDWCRVGQDLRKAIDVRKKREKTT